LPEFSGLKICYRKNGLEGFPEIRRIGIPNTGHDKLVFEEVGIIGSGGNSGFQALNLALQWGAKKILLVGFDMTDASGVHWYGRNNWRDANNPNDNNFKRWIAAFDGTVTVLKQRGIEVINCSPFSALQRFPKMSIEDAL
jgi:hypothetical protein